jgi:hypothetical protein
VTARRAIVASMAVASLALAALGDWNIGVVGNRIKVEGNAIRPWNPRSLGAKLACWFDADDPATLLDAGGAPADAAEAVQTWQDKSGNARHATAPEGANRPTRQVNVQNGRAVVRTDGNDSLGLSSALGVFRNKTAGHIFIVAKDSNSAGGANYHIFAQWDRNTAGTGRAAIYGRHTSFANGWVGGARRLDADTPVATVFGAQTGHALAHTWMDWSGGYLRMQINGSAYTSTAFSSGAGASSDTDSASVYFMTDLPSGSEIAEVIVVNAAMSTDEIKAINNYLRKKWGTP